MLGTFRGVGAMLVEAAAGVDELLAAAPAKFELLAAAAALPELGAKLPLGGELPVSGRNCSGADGGGTECFPK